MAVVVWIVVVTNIKSTSHMICDRSLPRKVEVELRHELRSKKHEIKMCSNMSPNLNPNSGQIGA